MVAKETMIWVVIAAVVVGGVFLLAQQRSVPSTPPLDENTELYLNALALGKDAGNYSYRYTENVDGYIIDTTLRVQGNTQQVDTRLPFARQQFFFSDNVSILCAELRNIPICNDVNDEPGIQDVLAGMRQLFFNRIVIEQSVQYNRRLIEKGVLQFEGTPTEKTVNGYGCKEIRYRYDHTQLSLSDLSALNINPRALPQFEAQWCVDDEGNVYEKVISYQIGDAAYETRWQLQEADWAYTKAIPWPDNATNATTVETFSRIRTFQAELMGCYRDGDTAGRERCIASFAIGRNLPDVCGAAGTRSDRCYISLALSRGDVTLCGRVVAPDATEDCYLEVAGRTRNPDLCSDILNTTKQAFCMNVSTAPLPEPPPTSTTEEPAPLNQSGSTLYERLVNDLGS